MENNEALELAKKSFQKLTKTNITASGIEEFINDNEILKKNAQKEDIYPRLKLSFKNVNLDNIIKLDSSLQPDLKTPLEKFFYAVLWKQGDLKKLSNIIAGLQGSVKPKTDTGYVFFYYGKHLKDPTENPIIDQHIIRAYRLMEKANNLSEEKITKIRKKDIIRKGDVDEVEKFIKWFNGKFKDEDLRYQADRLLFATGKAIKI